MKYDIIIMSGLGLLVITYILSFWGFFLYTTVVHEKVLYFVRTEDFSTFQPRNKSYNIDDRRVTLFSYGGRIREKLYK